MKWLRALTGSVVVAGLATVAVGMAQDTTDPFTKQTADLGTIRIAGVCQGDSSQIKCWKPTGEPNPKLSEVVSAYYLVNTHQRLQIQYRRRSLMLIVESEPGPSGRPGGSFPGISVQPGGSLISQAQMSPGGSGNAMKALYWYYPPDSVETVDVTVDIHIPQPTVELPLKVGAEAAIGERRIKILEIGRMQSPSENQRDKGPIWSVKFELSPTSSVPQALYVPTAFGEDGQQVYSVDDKGNPSASPQEGFPYNGFLPFRQIITTQGQDVWLSRVNPAKIDHLAISPSKVEHFEFKNVALKPRTLAGSVGR